MRVQVQPYSKHKDNANITKKVHDVIRIFQKVVYKEIIDKINLISKGIQ